MKTNGLFLLIGLGLTTGCITDGESGQDSSATPGVVNPPGDGGDSGDNGTDSGSSDIQGFLDLDQDGFPSRDGCLLGDDNCIDTDPGEGEDDCDDDDPDTHPDADELCDGIDNDCDGAIDDQDTDVTDAGTYYVDADHDGYGDEPVVSCTMPENAVEIGGDCNDANGDVHPSGVEVCDGFDNDCDSTIDNDAIDALTFYTDADSDGYGDAEVLACNQPSGASDIGGDCDDTDDDVSPGERETVVDGVDTDCSGAASDAETSDTDGDSTNDWYDDIVVEIDCTNVNAYHDTVDFSGESFWYEHIGWWTLPVCYQLEEDTETLLLVDDSVPDQDVWSAVVTGGYLYDVDDEDTEVTYWGMVFGYIDEDNYSVVYYSEEDEVFGFEQYVSGSLNEYETTSASGLEAGDLGQIEVTVYEYSGTPRLEASITDTTGSAGTIATLDFELDSFWGNLEGQFGVYSEGGQSFIGSSDTYPEYSSYLEGGGAP